MLKRSTKIPPMNRAEGMCLRETWEDFRGVRVLGWSKACDFRLRKRNKGVGVWLGGRAMGERMRWQVGIGKAFQLCDIQCTRPLRYKELKWGWVVFFSHHIGTLHKSKVFLVQCC